MEYPSKVTFTILVEDQKFEIRQTKNNKFFWLVVDAWIKIDSFSEEYETEKECLISLYDRIALELA